jgi:hypothetical protein
MASYARIKYNPNLRILGLLGRNHVQHVDIKIDLLPWSIATLTRTTSRQRHQDQLHWLAFYALASEYFICAE